jgi:polysaccharide pyruvyl transferase WcaK-like protein
VQVIEHVSKPAQIIAQLARLDAVIAMKLHAGIFAAIAGTPYLPWAYRPKVEDFAAALSLESLVVRTDVGSEAILAAFNRLQQQAEPLRQQIATGIHCMRRQLVSFAQQVVPSLVESN